MSDEEKSLKELQAENLRIQNDHLKEQTEFYREQNEQSRARRNERARMHATQEETLAANRKLEAASQRNCNHKKGGKGDDLVNNHGNDPNFAVIKHQYPWGEWSVFCTRCFADWRPWHTEKNHPTGIAFKTAFEWPTDNAASGSCQFRMPERRQPEARQELVTR